MGSFELLSKHMQKKIWDMKWDSFTPIQDKTIPVIMTTNKDVIISSGTASGKTEAAFLPIISKVEKEAESKLKVIYVSPLKALINNQFDRIEKLCEYNNISIHRWHGDVSQSKKKKFIKHPSGILQITPESIESLFINRTNHIKEVFKDVDFIVIDEIHSFIDSARGVQLRSLLSRMERYALQRPRIIGLSATINNFELVKNWVNHKDKDNVEIIESEGSDKELLYYLMHFDGGEGRKIPVELFEDMRNLTKNQKSIIFCNSRGTVEETTVFLNRLAEREKVGETYYAHHSSIDKVEREYVEKTMMESKYPKSVVATSSLELGIDIGDVDVIVQLDSTYTVSSLKQRLGRSGRKKESNQMLQLYTTQQDSLLQSLAVMELILEKWIEPAKGYPLPYDVLFQQIISMCQEFDGLLLQTLMEKIRTNHIFYSLDRDDVEKIIHHMINDDKLEVIRGSNELIVGLEGERILRSKDFYAVFLTPEEYEVVTGIRKIGKLDKLAFINDGDNIILAGKLWTIKEVDEKRNKIHVSKAVNGKPPRYLGGAGKIHKRIGERMMELLCSNEGFNYTNEEAFDILKDVRRKYHYYDVTPNERVVWETRGEIIFETFTGTVISQTLFWMLRTLGVKVKSIDGIGRIRINDNFDFDKTLKMIKEKEWTEQELVDNTEEKELFTTKFSVYLPQELQVSMHVANEIDIDGALAYINNCDFRWISL